MLVTGKDQVQQQSSLAGLSHAATLQVLGKSLFRRHRYLDFTKRVIFGHDLFDSMQ
jgi:hypothetical protein